MGLFSENLDHILMALLRDNDELKDILKIGFKEVEREMSELDNWMRSENAARMRENDELRELLEKQCGDLADCLHKTTADLVKKFEEDTKNLEHILDTSKETFKKELEDKKLELEEKLDDRKNNFNGISLDIDSRLESLESVSKQNLCSLEEKLNNHKNDLLNVISTKQADSINSMSAIKQEMIELVEHEKEERRLEDAEITVNNENKIKEVKVSTAQELKEAKGRIDQTQSEVAGLSERLQASQKDASLQITDCENKLKRRIDDIECKLESSAVESAKKLDEGINNIEKRLESDQHKTELLIKDAAENYVNRIDETAGKIRDLEASMEVTESQRSAQIDTINRRLLGDLTLQEENLARSLSTLQENVNDLQSLMEEKVKSAAGDLSSLEGNLSERLNRQADDCKEGLRQALADLTLQLKENCDLTERNCRHRSETSGRMFGELTEELEKERLELRKRMVAGKEAASLAGHEDRDAELASNEFVEMFDHFDRKFASQADHNSRLEERLDSESKQIVERLEEDCGRLLEGVEKERKVDRAKEQEMQRDMKKFFDKNEVFITKKLGDIEKQVKEAIKSERDTFELFKMTVFDKLGAINQLINLPCSVYFTAYRNESYITGGEEFLTFTDCSVNQPPGALDPKSGVFVVPVSGVYLLSLHLCSSDHKKVLASLRRNNLELGSMYNQDHVDNHKNSMAGQVILVDLVEGDKIQIYMYTGSGITDKTSNHFTQFCGALLRPATSHMQ